MLFAIAKVAVLFGWHTGENVVYNGTVRNSYRFRIQNVGLEVHANKKIGNRQATSAPTC
jgi:hypothetical protein